jgi:protein TonB
MSEALRRPLLPDLEDPRDQPEGRLLRWSLTGAVAVHALLLPLPVPTSAVKAAVEPPARAVFEIVDHKLAPPAPPTPVEPPIRPREAAVTIPVPEVDAPEPLPDDTPLPMADPIADDMDGAVFTNLPAGPPPGPSPPAGDEPIYVGGDVEPPEALHAPPPRYPELARVAGRDGLVVLQAVIDRDGTVRDVRVLRGAPFGMTEAAVEAVRTWRFRPARRAGEPVAVYYQLTVRFRRVR